MEGSVIITKKDIAKLEAFHRQHIQGQPVPAIRSIDTPGESHPTETSSADLGFYEDGTRRTLTDDQIAMFRHSEIQRLLAERRHQKEAEEERMGNEESRKSASTQVKDLNSKPSRFDNDATVHARGQFDELSYDEDMPQQNTMREKKFLWPVLGS